MAALSKNGTELARLVRVSSTPSMAGEMLEVQLSVRSNGWILKASRWVGRNERLAWGRWKRFKPFDGGTVTLPMYVGTLVRDIGFTYHAGGADQVQLGWAELCEGVRRGR